MFGFCRSDKFIRNLAPKAREHMLAVGASCGRTGCWEAKFAQKGGWFVRLPGRRSLGGDYGSGVPCCAGCENEVAWFAESSGCLLGRTM